jgi:hypothetical protein
MFWPPTILKEILTPGLVKAELLQKLDESMAENCTQKICNADQSNTSSSGGIQTYYRVFALLVLLEQPELIADCIAGNPGYAVSDKDLPLQIVIRPNTGNILLRKAGDPMSLFPKWKNSEKDCFSIYQVSVSPHFFSMNRRNEAKHFELAAGTVLPWIEDDEPPADNVGGQGAHGVVKPVRIHPGCHDFGGVLNKVGPPPPFSCFKAVGSVSRIKIPEQSLLTEDICPSARFTCRIRNTSPSKSSQEKTRSDAKTS